MEGSVSPMSSVATALNTAISDVATALLGIVTTNVPIVLPVVGSILLVAFGIKFMRRFAK